MGWNPKKGPWEQRQAAEGNPVHVRMVLAVQLCVKIIFLPEAKVSGSRVQRFVIERQPGAWGWHSKKPSWVEPCTEGPQRFAERS